MLRPTALLMLAVVLLAGCASVGERNGSEESSMPPSTPYVTPDDGPSDIERAVDIIGNGGDANETEEDETATAADAENETRDEDMAREDEDNETAEGEEDGAVGARGANDTEEWPTNGSFVTYNVHGISTVRSALRETDVNATWTYFDGEWELDCEGEYKSTPRSVRDTVRWQNGTFSVMGDEETPRDASPLAEPNRRGRVTAWLLEDCEPDRMRFRNATAEDVEERRLAADEEDNETENETDLADLGGQRAFGGRTREIVYDPDTGVLLSWREIGSRGKHIEGEVVDTDAPIGR